MTIILLDLNYMLVSNSEEKHKPFLKQIEHETYRQGLIELVRPHHVILVTARPVQYEKATLASIKEKTNFQPAESYFNNIYKPPQVFKMHVFDRFISKKHKPGDMLAIESNPRTIEGYLRRGVFCLTLGDKLLDYRTRAKEAEANGATG